jgi:hypothetical protein
MRPSTLTLPTSRRGRTVAESEEEKVGEGTGNRTACMGVKKRWCRLGIRWRGRGSLIWRRRSRSGGWAKKNLLSWVKICERLFG